MIGSLYFELDILLIQNKYEIVINLVNEYNLLNKTNNQLEYFSSIASLNKGDLIRSEKINTNLLNDSFNFYYNIYSVTMIDSLRKNNYEINEMKSDIILKMISYYKEYNYKYGVNTMVVFLILNLYFYLRMMKEYNSVLLLIEKLDKEFIREFMVGNNSILFKNYLFKDSYTFCYFDIELCHLVSSSQINTFEQFLLHFTTKELKRYESIATVKPIYKEIATELKYYSYNAERLNDKNDTSIQHLEEFLQNDPNDIFVNLLIGHISRKNLDLNKAIIYYTTAIKSVKRKIKELERQGDSIVGLSDNEMNPYCNIWILWKYKLLLADCYSYYAAVYRVSGRYFDSIQILNEYTQLYPNMKSILIYYQYICNFFVYGSLQDVLIAFNNFFENGGYLFLNGIEKSEGDFFLCIPLFLSEDLVISKNRIIPETSGIEVDPNLGIEEAFEMAQEKFLKQNYTTSYELLKICENTKNDFISLINSTVLHLLPLTRTKLLSLSLEQVERYIKVAEIFVTKGVQWKSFNINLEWSYSMFSMSLLYFPNQIDALYERSLLLIDNQYYNNAITDLNICVQHSLRELSLDGLSSDQIKHLKKRILTFYIEIGIIKRQLNLLNESISAFHSASEYDNNNPAVLSHRSLTYVLQGNYLMAIKDLQVLINECIQSERLADDTQTPFVCADARKKYYLQLSVIFAYCAANSKQLYDNHHYRDTIVPEHVFSLEEIPLVSSRKAKNEKSTINAALDIIVNYHYFQKSYSTFELLMKMDSRIPDSYYFRGFLYEKAGYYEKGMADYNKCLELDETHYYCRLARGILYINTQKYDKALDDLLYIYKNKGSITSLYSCLGLTYQNLNEYIKALGFYDLAINESPNDIDSYFYRGCSLLKLNIFDKSLEDFNHVIAANNQHVDTYIYRGYLHFLQKDYSSSLRDYSDALRYLKNDISLYENRASILYYTNQIDNSMADFFSLLSMKMDGNFSHASANRGLIYYKKNEYSRALMDCNSAIRLNPECQYSYLYRALVHMKLGNLEMSLADFNIAIPRIKDIVKDSVIK